MKNKFLILIISILIITMATPVFAGMSLWKVIGGKIMPVVSSWELGSSTVRIAKGWFQDLDVAGTMTLGGTVGSGGIDLDGNPLIMDADGNSQIIADNNDIIDFDIGGNPSVLSVDSLGNFAINTSNFVVDNIGNVGIGTASPGAKLDVNGLIYAGKAYGTRNYDELLTDPNAGGQYLAYTTNLASGQEDSRGIWRFIVHSWDYGAGLQVWDEADDTTKVFFNLNTSAKSWINTGNDLGIGMTNPETTLDVNGIVMTENSQGYYVENTAGGNVQLVNLDASNQPIFGDDSASTGDSYWKSRGNMNLYVNGQTRLFIDSANGNVGIGTTSPEGLLHLQSPNVLDTPRADIVLARYWASNSDTRASSIFHYHESSNGEDKLAFGVSGGGGSNEQPNQLSQIKMVIQADGDVGIGTTTPASILEVASNGSADYLHLTNLTSGDILKVDSAGDLAVNTNTLYVDKSAGYVGIGTTGPSWPLTVNGNIGFYKEGTYNMGLNIGFNTSNNATNMTFRDISQTNTNYQTVYMEANDYYFKYGGNVNTGLRIDSVGDVGIGTTTPAFKLDVNGDLRANKYIVQNSVDGGSANGIWMWNALDSNWGIYMGQSGAGKSLSGGTATTGVAGFAAHAIRTRVADSGTQGIIFENSSEQLLYSVRGDGAYTYLAGDVGIGTTSPSQLLHVSSSGTNPRVLVESTAASSTSEFDMRAKDGSGTVKDINLFNGLGKFGIWTTDYGTALTIQQDGNVGIGAASPGAKLEVNGGIRLNTATAKPTCDANQRGTTWFVQGASGIKDTFEVCAKDSGDVYAWRTLY